MLKESFLPFTLHASVMFENFFNFILLKNVYFWGGGGAEREGDTESEVDSRFSAVSTEPNVGLQLTNREIMT